MVPAEAGFSVCRRNHIVGRCPFGVNCVPIRRAPRSPLLRNISIAGGSFPEQESPTGGERLWDKVARQQRLFVREGVACTGD